MKAKKNSLPIILILINNTLTLLFAFAIHLPKNRHIFMIQHMNNREREIMKAADGSCDDDNENVILGPDLNSTRSKMDKKLYRHITLSNGLKCVLISDTVAMKQRKLEGHYDDESGGRDEEYDDDGSDGEG